MTVLRQGFAKPTRRRRGVGEGRGCALGKVWLPSHTSTIYRDKGEAGSPLRSHLVGGAAARGRWLAPQARGGAPL